MISLFKVLNPRTVIELRVGENARLYPQFYPSIFRKSNPPDEKTKSIFER
jgi:hypothetical protein